MSDSIPRVLLSTTASTSSPEIDLSDILFCREGTDVDEKELLDASRRRLFPTEIDRCWLDIYIPRRHQLEESVSPLDSLRDEDTAIEFVLVQRLGKHQIDNFAAIWDDVMYLSIESGPKRST
jgi:hypothetical protein